jgi:LuxR family transcriptional regulator
MESKFNAQQTLQQEYQTKILTIGNHLQKQILRIEDIGDYIPGSVMVQNLNTMTNSYMNESGCNILKHSSEELESLGPEYFSRFFPVEEMSILKHQLMQIALENDPSKIHSFFQRVRPNIESEFKWYFTTSRMYPSTSPEDGLKMMHISVPADSLSYVGRKLDNLVEDNLIVRNNLHRFILLSRREKEIIKLIVEGKSSAEISNYLFISIHTVNNHRKNILHKLDINSLSKLIRFAVAFSII